MRTNRSLLTLILTSVMYMATAASYADDSVTGPEAMSDEQRRAAHAERRAQRESMSEEERQAAREERRARWESMSEEERQALREQRANRKQDRREARRERWEGMSEEERQAMREKRHERRGAKGKGHGKQRPPAAGTNDEA